MGLLRRLFSRDDNSSDVATRRHASQLLTRRSSGPVCDGDLQAGARAESWYVPSDAPSARFLGPDGLPTLRLIPYQDAAGERVLRLIEDDTGLLVGPTHRGLLNAGVYVSQLRGESYHEASCRRGNFTPGARVRLFREPDNPHDQNAVAVYDATGRHMAAYVNKQKARALARLLDGGTIIEAVSLRGTAAGKPCEQVAIAAAEPPVLARLLSPRPSHLPPPAHER